MGNATALKEANQPMMRDSSRLETFRTIHYLGNKRRILGDVLGAIDRVAPSGGTLVDLFSGSGSVSYGASFGRSVISVDIQGYARVIAAALLSPPPPPTTGQIGARYRAAGDALRLAASPLLKLERAAFVAAQAGDMKPLSHLIEDGSLIGASQGHLSRHKTVRAATSATLTNLTNAGLADSSSVALRHYGGTFFSYEQAIEIDAIVANIRSGQSFSDVALAALLGAVSESVNTVGNQFAQPMRLTDKAGNLKLHLKSKVLRDRSADVAARYRSFLANYLNANRSAIGGHEAIQGDYRDILPTLAGRIAVVYADPPYTRDHYSRFYHVLETLSVGDDPAIDASNLDGGAGMSRGFYRTDRHQSDFCIKSKAPGAFRALFDSTNKLRVPLVLSYSAFDDDRQGRPRVMTVRDVREIGEQYFNQAIVREVSGMEHNKLNAASLNKGTGTTKEVLFEFASPK